MLISMVFDIQSATTRAPQTYIICFSNGYCNIQKPAGSIGSNADFDRVNQLYSRRTYISPLPTYLFTMFELPHDAIVIPLGDALRITNSALDEGLQASFEQLIDLVVIIIVVPYAEHTLYVVPDRSSEARRVDLVVRAHRVVRQIICGLELVIEEIADVVVETVHQGVAVVVPGAVLDAKGRYVVELTALKDERSRRSC